MWFKHTSMSDTGSGMCGLSITCRITLPIVTQFIINDYGVNNHRINQLIFMRGGNLCICVYLPRLLDSLMLRGSCTITYYGVSGLPTFP